MAFGNRSALENEYMAFALEELMGLSEVNTALCLFGEAIQIN